MKKSLIRKITAKEILDSRGNPTIEVKLSTSEGIFFASVPSGASRGKHEAKELRDKDGGVSKAIKNIEEKIGPRIIGRDPREQEKIDGLMIKLDGTKNKSKLGANAILAVSMAVCRAGAASQNQSLWKYITQCDEALLRHIGVPRPAFNLIEGGVHAKNKLAFQEFMIVPKAKNFEENLKIGIKIYDQLKKDIKQKYGKIIWGDEGGFAPDLNDSREALEFLGSSIKKAGFKGKIDIILDAAASQFYKKGKYELPRPEGRGIPSGKFLWRLSSPPQGAGISCRHNKENNGLFSAAELVTCYSELIKNYPIIGIEDPFSEEDWEGWQLLNSQFLIPNSQLLIIGDDLITTNTARIKKAKKTNVCSGCIIKPNQVGTVTETIEAVKLTKSFGWKIIVSHRSGETRDNFIADLAVGVGADFIKSGAPFPKERMSKYRRLAEIEKEIN